MKRKIVLISIIFTGLLFTLFVSFAYSPAPKKWVAPASADKIVNPLKGNAKAVASGEKIYTAMCVVCHGAKGKGDGIAATGLTPKPSDLTSKDVQSQSDGAIFWKIAVGRSPMASYKKSIPEKNRWEIINYLRTLK